jgi:hypothetical protein
VWSGVAKVGAKVVKCAFTHHHEERVGGGPTDTAGGWLRPRFGAEGSGEVE